MSAVDPEVAAIDCFSDIIGNKTKVRFVKKYSNYKF